MTMTWGRLVGLGGLSLYLFVLGFGGGMVAERRAEAPPADGAPDRVVR